MPHQASFPPPVLQATPSCSPRIPVPRIKRRWGNDAKPSSDMPCVTSQMHSGVVCPDCIPVSMPHEPPHVPHGPSLVDPVSARSTVFWCVRRCQPSFIPATEKPELCWSVSDAQCHQEQQHEFPVRLWAYTCNDSQRGWACNLNHEPHEASLRPCWVELHGDWCSSCCSCWLHDADTGICDAAHAKTSHRWDGLLWPDAGQVRQAAMRWTLLTLAVSPFCLAL